MRHVRIYSYKLQKGSSEQTEIIILYYCFKILKLKVLLFKICLLD